MPARQRLEVLGAIELLDGSQTAFGDGWIPGGEERYGLDRKSVV